MGKKILVVDDSKTMLMRSVMFLKKHGFEVVTSSAPLDVIDILRKDKFDLIILDIEMPGVTGYRLCEMIKDEETLEDIPVVFFSSRDEYLDKLKGFAVGGVEYLDKNCPEEEYIETINSVLEREDI